MRKEIVVENTEQHPVLIPENDPTPMRSVESFPEGRMPYYPVNEAENFRGRWSNVQAAFVDDPQAAVREADSLVSSVTNRLIESFAGEREQIEKNWSGSGEASTEDLRQALRQYRSLFERLLSI